jgi:flagellar biosynthesis protein FlhG
VADRIASVTRQFLGIEIDRMGFVLTDENVSTAVRRRRPFALEFPKSAATYCMRALSGHYVGQATTSARSSEGFFARLLHVFGSSATGEA